MGSAWRLANVKISQLMLTLVKRQAVWLLKQFQTLSTNIPFIKLDIAKIIYLIQHKPNSFG